MITPALMRNRQFTGANTAMVLFGCRRLRRAVPALAGVPEPLGLRPVGGGAGAHPRAAHGHARVARSSPRAPTRGRRARSRCPPCCACRSGSCGSPSCPSTSESLGRLPDHAPRPAMIGVGLGTVFPAINVGAMGVGLGARAGAGVGDREHRAPARCGDRGGAPGGHGDHRVQLHARLRARGHRGRQRPGRAAPAAGRRGSGCASSPTTWASPRDASIPGPASTRSPPARRRAPPATPSAGASASAALLASARRSLRARE